MSLFRAVFIFWVTILAAIPAVAEDADFEITVNRNRLTVGQSLQMNLPRSRSQQVRPSHHAGDALVGVIHDDGQLVGKQAVTSFEHKVAHIARQRLLLRSL